MILAARFALYTGDLSLASRIAKKLQSGGGVGGSKSATPFELEAMCVDYWITIEDALSDDGLTGSDARQKLQGLDSLIKGRVEATDVDMLMVWAMSKLVFRQTGEALNIYNQITAVHSWFTASLADKAMLLASAGEWEQALDCAQQVLDVDRDNLDALLIIAVHAFTQEAQPLESLQKLEEYESILVKKEPTSIKSLSMAARLFSGICCRDSRALQVCVRLVERAQRCSTSSIEDSELLCLMGSINMLQGSGMYETAMRVYREASKRDANNMNSLEGMILCQLREGMNEDAEGQLELISVMHSSEELSPHFSYLQALLAKQSHKDTKKHLTLLDNCRERKVQQSKQAPLIANGCVIPFQELQVLSPDYLMMLAMEYLEHLESAAPATLGTGSSVGGKSSFSAFSSSAPTSSSSSSSSTSSSSSSSAAGPSATSGGSGGALDSAMSADATSTGDVSVAVQSGIDLLTKVIRLYPGTSCAYVELSRCYMSLKRADEAIRTLHQCMNLRPHYGAALIAIAKVELSRQNTTAADRALEQALASDFSIRSVPLFRLLQASVRGQQGRVDEAIAEMEQIMALPELQALSGSGGRASMHTESLRLTDDDRVAAYVTRASILSRARRLKEANKVLSEAKIVFAGSPQEVQVLVAASQLAVERNDFDTAIRMLDKITDDSPTYLRAQIIKSEILLMHNRDKEGFTQCYRSLVEKDPSAKNWALFGEAYLRILNPEASIEALNKAYKLDPTNSRLRARIGRALVATHEYHRAVEFYEAAIRDVSASAVASTKGPRSSAVDAVKYSESVALSHDLAKLFIKLGRAGNAIRILQNILHTEHRDLTDLRQDVSTYLLLAEVQKTNGEKLRDQVESLEKARSLQKEVVSQVRMGVTQVASSSEVVDKEKAALSDICEKIGQYYFSTSGLAEGASGPKTAESSKQAETMFQESITHNLMNVKAMLGLAKLYRARGEGEQAQAQCRKIILADPSQEEATTMLSELLFHGPDPEGAVVPLQDLLRAFPNNYHALEKLINLLRRSGKLEEAAAIIKAAEEHDRRSLSHAGLHYCKGLYAFYTNDIGKAIVEFNLARKDETWGTEALTYMIELYLNPNRDGAWDEKDNGPLDEAALANIAAAETLLKELKPRAKDDLRFSVLENNWMLATRQKTFVDKAMQSFAKMLEANQDYLPAVHGMATGFMIEKNQHKARNLLKRVAKMEPSLNDGEDYVKLNLLLAKFYVDKSQYDQAQDLCKRCLAQNKSSSQAWEILGLIMEKEGSHERAAECYEKAWNLEFQASAPIGFKLAFSYLKCKHYLEAIDICEAVLTLFPDYPRIKEEILKKAQSGIRGGKE